MTYKPEEEEIEVDPKRLKFGDDRKELERKAKEEKKRKNKKYRPQAH